jgi:hypothetical protein
MDVRADLSDAAVLAVVDGPTPILAMPDAFRADRELGWNTVVRPVRCSAVKSRRGKSTRASRSRARVRCAALASRRAKSSKSASSRSAKSRGAVKHKKTAVKSSIRSKKTAKR